VGLERGPLSLVSTIEELIGIKKAAAPVSNAENTAVGIRCADQVVQSITNLALTSPTVGGRSVGAVRS
jgi:hypothetical protein